MPSVYPIENESQLLNSLKKSQILISQTANSKTTNKIKIITNGLINNGQGNARQRALSLPRSLDSNTPNTFTIDSLQNGNKKRKQLKNNLDSSNSTNETPRQKKDKTDDNSTNEEATSDDSYTNQLG